MTRPTVFIDGEYGTTGLQIRRRLEGRDDIEMLSIDHDKRRDDNEKRRLLNAADVVILCLPDDAAKASVAMIDNPDVRVLDASTAHRVADGWTYGFPELTPTQATEIAEASRVANPGCWPTGMLGLVRPLVDAELLPADFPVTISGVSGYTGGGRSLIEAYEKNEIGGPHHAYGLELKHKHVPEMHKYSHLTHKPLFYPAHADFPQGMLVELGVPLWALPKHVSGEDMHAVLSERYEGERFVKVMPHQPMAMLNPAGIVGSNVLELYVFDNPAEEQALLVARLDNLGKGASGAAVQNLDLMLGLSGDRSYGLTDPTKLDS